MKTLVHWIDAGAPRGAGEDPLKKVAFQAPEWPLGKPDVVLEHPGREDPGHRRAWTTSTRWCR